MNLIRILIPKEKVDKEKVIIYMIDIFLKQKKPVTLVWVSGFSVCVSEGGSSNPRIRNQLLRFFLGKVQSGQDNFHNLP